MNRILALGALIAFLAGCGEDPPKIAPVALALPDSIEFVEPLFDELYRERKLVFGTGDHLDGLLTRVGITAEDRRAAIIAVAASYDLGRFRAGHALHIRQDWVGRLITLHYPVDFDNDLCLWREGDRFEAEVFEMQLDWTPFTAEANLAPSFYEDLQRRGYDGNLATRVADLFSGEIDFFLDLHAGDRMEILLERCRRPDRDEEKTRVLAARLTVSGKNYEAFFFPEENGTRHYYHADGGSLARQFLRAPLSFTRISSGFSRSRLHPILKIRRPHPGIDYAAPIGTPVMATADGTIIRRARDGQAGRHLKIRHAGGIETTYMHFSRFANGTAQGRRVRQGQVIGFVGQSGLATGPHLDYRMKVGGKYTDPRHFRSEPANPLADERMIEFAEAVEGYERLWAKLLAPEVALGGNSSESDSQSTE